MKYDNDGDVVKFEARHEFTLFPTYSKTGITLGEGDDTYGIVKWNIRNELEGKVKHDGFYEVIVKGEYKEPINSSSEYTILAKEVNDPSRGMQYELLWIGEVIDFSSINNQRGFLKSFLSDGQIDEFIKIHPNPLAVIESHDIEAIKKVKGVGDYISQCIIDRFERNKDYCTVYIELDTIGLSPKLIQKLINTYSSPEEIVDIVKNRPYELAYSVDGIGFGRADEIAMNGGLHPKSKERIEAYFLHYLEQIAQEGHSYTTAGILMGALFEQFGGKHEILELVDAIDEENQKLILDEEGNPVQVANVTLAIETLIKKKLIVVEESELDENGEPLVKKSKRRVYLQKYYDLEKRIADKLCLLYYSTNQFIFKDWKKTISHIEEKQGWKHTPEQYDGIQACLDNQVIFITGGAGTGKTSVLTGALHALGCYNGDYTFAQTALSGKASARMQEVTGQDGMTIHRLLGYQPPVGFQYNSHNPLEQDIVVLDEVSLCGGQIFKSLIDALEGGKKLIILGDMGQLEAIGCMNVAQDLFDNRLIAVVELTKTHRQAEKSGGIVASRSIRIGETVFDDNFEGEFTIGELQDMHFDVSSERDDTTARVMKHYKNYWKSGKVKSVMDIQVLVSVKDRGAKDGSPCAFVLNNKIQRFVNPYHEDKPQIEIKYSKELSFKIRLGDKVMNLKNNYKKFTTEGEMVSVFNGWEGTVEKIDIQTSKVHVYFPLLEDTVIFSKGECFSALVLGYASTLHKYQGSSAKYIIGAIDYLTPPSMLVREFPYTLITRMELECTIVCQNSAFNKAVRTSRVKVKQTFLVEMLNAFLSLSEEEKEKYLSSVYGGFRKKKVDINDREEF